MFAPAAEHGRSAAHGHRRRDADVLSRLRQSHHGNEPPIVAKTPRKWRHAMHVALIVVAIGFAQLGYSAEQFQPPLNIPSPDGRYVVGAKLANPETAGSGGPEYELFLTDRAAGVERILDRFIRGADVLWSSDGRQVAVTFWASSNESYVAIYWVKPTFDVLRIGDGGGGRQIATDLASLPEVSGNDHVYFQALAWQGSAALRVKVFGHGDRDPQGFAKCFDLPLGPGASRRVPCPPGRDVQ